MQRQVSRLLPYYIRKGRIGQRVNKSNHFIKSYRRQANLQGFPKQGLEPTIVYNSAQQGNNVEIHKADKCITLPHVNQIPCEVTWDEDNDECTFQDSSSQPYLGDQHVQKHFESLEFDNLLDWNVFDKNHSTKLSRNKSWSAIETPASLFVACECEYDDETFRESITQRRH